MEKESGICCEFGWKEGTVKSNTTRRFLLEIFLRALSFSSLGFFRTLQKRPIYFSRRSHPNLHRPAFLDGNSHLIRHDTTLLCPWMQAKCRGELLSASSSLTENLSTLRMWRHIIVRPSLHKAHTMAVTTLADFKEICIVLSIFWEEKADWE